MNRTSLRALKKLSVSKTGFGLKKKNKNHHRVLKNSKGENIPTLIFVFNTILIFY